jgi:hypothetical protein
MTREDIGPLKAIAVWAFIIVGGLATACISFICFLSIWEGFTHIHQSGSWVPIVAGTVVFGMAAWVYVRLAKAFHRRLTSEELLNL